MKFLLATWGSLGDLHPFLSLGTALRQRGHVVTLAGNPLWRETVTSAGLDFLPAGPEQKPESIFNRPDLINSRNLGLASLRVLVRDFIVPTLRPVTETLLAAAPNYDALVAHHFVFPAGIVAQRSGVPWMSIYLAPGVKASRHFWPGQLEFAEPDSPLTRFAAGLIWTIGLRLTRPLVDPAINALRHDFGLPAGADHFFSGSPRGSLHLYSPAFSPLPPDWKEGHQQTGFCFWDHAPASATEPELEAFLQAGSKPWLVTLGSAIVSHPGKLYEDAVHAVAGTTRRAVLLVGHERNRPSFVPPNVFVALYASYGSLMPRCAGVIHQCGIGTTAQTLRAGLPSIACPYAFEQPNNAARLVRLGVARLLTKSFRTAPHLRAAMDQLENSDAPARAQALGQCIRAESGPEDSVRYLETFVRAHTCPT